MSDIEEFVIEGWNFPLKLYLGGISVCGRSIGVPMSSDGNDAGGVMDYNEVARLRNILGEWLRKVEDNGSYKENKSYWEKEWEKENLEL